MTQGKSSCGVFRSDEVSLVTHFCWLEQSAVSTITAGALVAHRTAVGVSQYHHAVAGGSVPEMHECWPATHPLPRVVLISLRPVRWATARSRVMVLTADCYHRKNALQDSPHLSETPQHDLPGLMDLEEL